MTCWMLGFRRRVVVLGIAFAMATAATPVYAQGFFEQLFGGGTTQPAQPTYDFRSQQPLSPDIHFEPLRPRPKRAIVANAEPLPQRQKTTDLWHDKTLHPGDAIMMKDGLHVYKGPETAKHTAKQFVPLDRARVSAREKTALIAMDTTRNDPLRTAREPDTLASGRSAAVDTPITKGVRITDARGASIRYVGPY